MPPTDRWDRPIVRAWLLAGLGLLYLCVYFSYPVLPGNSAEYPRGWIGWYDQSCYWREATAIAHGNLEASNYFYPLGYPLLGSLFVRWIPNHAFFLPNLAAVLVAATLLYRLARRDLGFLTSVLFLAAFIFSHRWLLEESLVPPWNTIPTFALFYGVIYLCLVGRGWSCAIAMSALAAAAYFVRPVDAACMAPMLVWAVLRLPDWRRRCSAAALGIGLIALAGGLVALFNERVFHSPLSDYDRAELLTGFGSYPWLVKAHLIFVDYSPAFFESSVAILFRYPWLLLGLPGAAYALQRWSWAGAAVLLSVALAVVLYLNYNDLWPYNLIATQLIHYWCWWFPLLALWTFQAVWLRPRGRLMAAARGLTPLALLALLLVRLEPYGSGAAPGHTRVALTSSSPGETQLRSGGRPLVRGRDYSAGAFGEIGTRLIIAPHVPADPTAEPATLTDLTDLHWRIQPTLTRLIWPLSEIPGLVSIRSVARGPWDPAAGAPAAGNRDQAETLVVAGPEWILDAATEWDVRGPTGVPRWASGPNRWKLWVVDARRSGSGSRTLILNHAGLVAAPERLEVRAWSSGHRLLLSREWAP